MERGRVLISRYIFKTMKFRDSCPILNTLTLLYQCKPSLFASTELKYKFELVLFFSLYLNSVLRLVCQTSSFL